MVNVNVRVNADADNCTDTDSGFPGFLADGPTGAHFFGNNSGFAPRVDFAGMLFRSVDAPSDATWDTVTNPPTITVNPANSANGDGEISVDVNGDEDGDPADWAQGTAPADATPTSVPVVWTFTPSTDVTEESPSLVAILQEITDTIGAVTDLAMWAESQPAGDVDKGQIDPYIDNNAAAALFDGDYTAGAGGGLTKGSLALLGVGL